MAPTATCDVADGPHLARASESASQEGGVFEPPLSSLGRTVSGGWGISNPSIPYPPDRVVVGEVRGAEVPRLRVTSPIRGAVRA